MTSTLFDLTKKKISERDIKNAFKDGKLPIDIFEDIIFEITEKKKKLVLWELYNTVEKMPHFNVFGSFYGLPSNNNIVHIKNSIMKQFYHTRKNWIRIIERKFCIIVSHDKEIVEIMFTIKPHIPTRCYKHQKCRNLHV